MIKYLLALSLQLAAVNLMAQTSVQITITSLPHYHAPGSDIYLAGSFNGWNPADKDYKFNRDEKGNYTITLQLATGRYEYKLTRGSWDNGECAANGTSIANRVLVMPSGTAVSLHIAEWQDRFPAKPKISTASRNVCIIDTAFLIPQLKRTRRVWIYLPPDYCDQPKKKYPVLYMHDGQNLFDDATSYSGEWGIDEFMDTTVLKKCIVVGIDHGETKRLNEYNPYDNERFGKGEGNAYADFLVKTLKPYIDKQYRTLRGKKTTAIAGSSMGGLISLYTVLKYPKVFGTAGVFSPAFWISGAGIFEDIKTKGALVNSQIYFYGGKREGETMVPDMLRAFEAMSAVSKSRMVTVIRDTGAHNEPTWRKEFPLFYEWGF